MARTSQLANEKLRDGGSCPVGPGWGVCDGAIDTRLSIPKEGSRGPVGGGGGGGSRHYVQRPWPCLQPAVSQVQ